MLTSILGLVTVALILIIIFQIARANEYITALRGDEEKAQERANQINSTLFLVFMVVGLAASFWSAWYYSPWYLPYPSSVHGVWIRNAFFWTLVATVPVFVVTQIALFWFSYDYRGREGHKAFYYPGSTKLEMIWTAIPAFVMVLLVYNGLDNWFKIMSSAPENALVMEATGQQFAWTLRYAGKDNKLGTKTVKLINAENAVGQDWKDVANHDDFVADELHMQVGRPILVKINAIDVLHNFSLPHFRVKMDAVPGIPTQFWFTPTKTTAQMRAELNDPEFVYELNCNQLCGQAHWNMRRVVVVEEAAEFEKWFASQKPTYQQLQEQPQAATTPTEELTAPSTSTETEQQPTPTAKKTASL